MLPVKQKDLCCGCTACANICPRGCIEMQADEEGFLYPNIRKDLCVSCGLCEKVCPVLQNGPETPQKQTGYLVQHRDETVRRQSTAGGAFTAIASYVLDRGGVVFGASYDQAFQVIHTFVEQKEQLARFRNSKYVQSRLGTCFRQVQEFLNQGRWVCFSGTPCQIEGLNAFLGRRHEHLVLVDVVCHGIPSPLVWNKYLQAQNISQMRADQILFRDKYYGYKYSTMSLYRGGVNIYHAGSQQDPMLRTFFEDLCDRPICYHCPFKKRYRVSDLTLWDCFSVYDFDRQMDDDRGTTRVLCHTPLGEQIMQAVQSEVQCRTVDPDRLVQGVREMVASVEENPRRSEFFQDACRLEGKALFQKYCPITWKTKLETGIRQLLLRTGLYSVAKKCLNKLRGR